MFPILKTGAVAQYPAWRSLRFQNEAVRFLDGSEQRYRDSAGPLRQWEILLDRLDATELAEIEEFFRDQQGRYGSFRFVDPWDECEYQDCSLEVDELPVTVVEEMQGATTLTVVENRV
jgi:hypothetical protein